MTNQPLTLNCPHCGRVNESHDHTEGAAQPVDGDVSICWGCRNLGIYQEIPFGAGLTIRKPTSTEQGDLDGDPRVRAALAAAAESYTPSQAVDLTRGGAR